MRLDDFIPSVLARCRSGAAGVSAFLRRSRDIDEIDDDLREYLELAVAEKVAGGRDRETAMREAHAELGNLTAARDEVLEAGWDHAVDCLRQDIRFGLRASWRDRRTLLPLAIVLATGIAPAIAALVILDAIYLRPLPIPAPQHVVRLAERHAGPSGDPLIVNMRVPRAAAILEPREGVVGSIATWRRTAVVGAPHGVVSASVVFHTPGWGRTMGVAVAHGRGVTDAEEKLGLHSQKAVVSDRFWRRHLDRADPGSRVLQIDGRSHTVIGVMPEGFRFPYAADVWIPSSLDAAGTDVAVFARFVNGTSANSALAVDDRVAIRSLRANLMEGQQAAALVLGGGAVLLLALVVGSVTSLLNRRAAIRRSDFVTRSVLGAPAARQLRQAIAQNVALALIGAAAGALAGLIVLPRALVAIPANFSEQLGVLPSALENRTLAIAGIVVAIATAFLALLPVFRQAFAQIESGERTSTGRVQTSSTWPVGVHCALVAMLVCAAGLSFRNLSRLEGQDLGFDHRGLMTIRLSDADPVNRLNRPWRRLVERLSALPEVAAVGITSVNPVTNSNGSASIEIEGVTPAGHGPMVAHRGVSPGYLGALGVPVLSGRDFTWSDHDGSGGAAIISAALARRLGVEANPIGTRIRVGGASAPWLTIVGVAGDIADVPSRRAETVYSPVSSSSAAVAPAGVHVTLRMRDDRRQAVTVIESVLAKMPGVVVHSIDGMADQRQAWLDRDRLVQESLSGAGVMAIALGAASVFAILVFGISRRGRELATRIVLGATPRDLVMLMLREHIPSVALAVAAGLVSSVGVNLVIAQVLPEVRPVEPLVIVAAAMLPAVCLLGSVGLVGRRCGRHDPAMLLRVE